MNKTYRFRRPQLIPTLFIIVATCVLASLSVWQLQRLAWKQQIIADIEKVRTLPPLEALDDSADIASLQYRKVSLKGHFLSAEALHLNGSVKGTYGFYYLLPFKLENGVVILADIGFVARSAQISTIATEKEQTLTGILLKPREKRFFAPANEPHKNVWFYQDIPAMQKALQIAQEPFPLILSVTEKFGQDTYPLPHNETILVRNDHLGYAITWFLLALTGLVMFVIYHVERERKNA